MTDTLASGYAEFNFDKNVAYEIGSEPDSLWKFHIIFVEDKDREIELEKATVIHGFENTLVCYTHTDGSTVTYKTPSEHYSDVLNSLKEVELDNTDWIKTPPAFYTHMTRNAIFGERVHIELPLAGLLVPFEASDLDIVTGDDFTHVETLKNVLSDKTNRMVKEITRIGEKLAMVVADKDHDLYLTFKGDVGLTQMIVGMQRVYPELPESGMLVVGDTPLSLEDWKDHPAGIQFQIRKVIRMTRQYNQWIGRTLTDLSHDERLSLLVPDFMAALKVNLMAATHYMKMLYGFDGRYAEKLVTTAANDVLNRLESVGGHIALDLNSWKVWDYSTPEPTHKDVPELDFINLYLNRRTESFMEALYGFLLETPHPMLKPYSRKEVVLEDDGIPVGTIFTDKAPPTVH